MKKPRWSKEEHEYIENLLGQYPYIEVERKFIDKGKRAGWPFRSRSAIGIYVNRNFKTREALDQNFTASALATLLGYKRDRVREWYRNGDLEVVKVGFLTKITPEALDKFAKKHPHYFSDADWTSLACLFGEKRADEIKQLPSSTKKRKPIRCLRTGHVYPSLTEAAEYCHFTRNTLRRRAELKLGFEFVEVA